MIFVTVGSQKFQFNRLLKQIDKLIDEKKINEKVIAQIGYSDYKPENYEYKQFMDRYEFLLNINNCSKVITHGGTGAIIGAVKKRKKVIAVARLKKFNEHVDNHQLEIIRAFEKMNFIKSINEIEELERAIKDIENINFDEYKSNTHAIIQSIDEFINY